MTNQPDTSLLDQTGTQKDPRPRFFALIVGIDHYKNSVNDLKGCVTDSTNVIKFLKESFGGSALHIKHLQNEQATREQILSAFEKHLIGNNKIMLGDPILFYFAGHGSSVRAPEGSHTANKMWEAICPYDYRTGSGSEQVWGIPDRTYDALMQRLATIKGDNIVSACFSLRSCRLLIDFFFPDSDHRFMSFQRHGTSPGVWECAVSLSS